MSHFVENDILLTSLRWLMGLALGTAIATACYFAGLLIPWLRGPLLRTSDFLRAIPVIALVPLFFHYFSIYEDGKVLMIAMATSLPIYIHIIYAVRRSADKELIFATAGMTRQELVRWVHIPMFVSAVIGGIQVAIGIGWISVVAAESLGALDRSFWDGGLGYQIINFASVSDYRDVYLYLGIFGVLGIGSAEGFKKLVRLLPRLTGLDLG